VRVSVHLRTESPLQDLIGWMCKLCTLIDMLAGYPTQR
jgi:hypothetical protein